MAILIDPATRRIVLDSANVTAQEIYRAWADWAALDDHLKFLPAFRSLGGDALGGGLFIPGYYFLLNGWRVRPMEASHELTITGNLFVEGGGVPVVPTLGIFQVTVNYTVPMQAQGVATSGSALSAGEIAAAVLASLQSAILPVNVKQVNDVTLTGTGVPGDSMRPA